MLCPLCRKGELEARYRLTYTTPVLDGRERPVTERELASLMCPRCEELWYAFNHETAESAYNRICKEELRP